MAIVHCTCSHDMAKTELQSENCHSFIECASYKVDRNVNADGKFRFYENIFSYVDVFVFSLVDIQLSLRCGCVTSSHREGALSETILDSPPLISCAQIKTPIVYCLKC